MKSKINLFNIIFLYLIIISCGIQNSTSNSYTVTAPSNTPTYIVETLSFIDTPTQVTPTLISIPTLSEEIALKTFVKIIEEGNECFLPCWLGITPGQTDFSGIENDFSQFSAITATKFSQERALINVFFPNFETAIHSTSTEIYRAEDGKVARIWVYAGMNPYEDGKWDYSNPEYQRMWKNYLISGVFKKHGTPEKIFFDTTLIAADTATSYPFVLWLVYPQQGFLLRYQGPNEKIGANINVCPMKSRIEIIIWDVKVSTYEDFMENDSAMGSISLGPQPIESVTDFDIDSFYNLFKDGNI